MKPENHPMPRALVCGLVLLALSSPGWSAGADLFPRPFLIEHHVEHHDADGGVMVGEAVVDHYLGSSIVSERADGSRTIIDLERREITEIRPDRATYSVIGFDRLAELQRRLARADRMQVGIVDEPRAEPQEHAADADDEPRFMIERGASGEARPSSAKAASLLERKGVERLIVRLDPEHTSEKAGLGEPLAVEVWIDPEVRLSQAARQALDRFEQEVLAATARDGRVPFSSYIAAAREHREGAIPIRTRRPATSDPAKASRSGQVEDVATRLELIERIPDELLGIPEGYRRQAHRLEAVVAFAEEEAERNLRSLRGAR